MKLIYTFLLVLISSFPAISQKKANLIYQLELNEVYRVKSTVVQNTTQSVMGNEQSVQTDNVMVLSLKPLKKTDSEMIAEIRFDTIKTVISQPPMEINSANPGDLQSGDPSKIMEALMHRMANSTFLARMDYSGRVLGFMNLEPVVSGILQGTDTLQGQMANFVLQRTATVLEEKSLKSMIESQTFYLPGREVKKNESWEVSYLVSGGGMEMNQKTNLKLENLEKDAYTITGDLITESLPGTMEMNGAKISSDISGLGKTEMKIDPATGWVIEGNSRQQLKGEMTVNAQGNNMNIPIEVNINSEIIALPSSEK